MSALKGSLSLNYSGFSLQMDFTIPKAAVTVVMGPSGAGKSTFLRCLAGLEKSQGELFFAEHLWQGPKTFVPVHKRNLGFVFQDRNLFPHLSVEGNLRLAMGRVSTNCFEWNHVIEIFGLKKILNRATTSLSGGEKQRVAMARAVLSSPQLLLMDEPLSALDMASKNEVLPFLEKMKSEFGVPTVYVTHSILEAARIGDYILLIEQGRLKEFDKVDRVFANDAVLRDGFSGLADLQKKFGVNI